MERPFAGSALASLAPFVISAGVGAVTLLVLALLPPATGAPRTVAPPPASSSSDTLVGRFDVPVETVAGGDPGLRDGALWEARFSGPNALALEQDGALLVCDSRNHRIRRITVDRRVETVAGGGAPGGPGGKSLGGALTARLRFPSGVAVDRQGIVYIADTGNHRVCRLKDKSITLVAGGSQGKRDGRGDAAAFNFPSALHVDEANRLWVLDDVARRVRRVSPDGVVASTAVVPSSVLRALGMAPNSEAPSHLAGWTAGGRTSALFGAHEGRRSPSAGFPSDGLRYYNARSGSWMGLEIFADPEHHVIMATKAPSQPMVIAGQRKVSFGIAGSRDGNGEIATFSVPAAVLWTGTALYVADYESNRVRRLTLPDWLLTGEQPNLKRRRAGAATRSHRVRPA